ncbi:dihydrofolate reductase [Paenibacillus sp. CAA11]|uniref:dihydrofolate reductase n=1 Tax=Paenibacillus sp. CAA11 TaxID=1532905 RepID=UPI000D3C9CEF|nr:dihydrofolate reductase [Paenibacillus sp. CAA11]AWB44840.1 dihydrofolate reductase [Paenibacillus sp. CAA11]
MSLTLIWAMAKNRVIGRDNKLPWRLPSDLAFFKAQTTGKIIVMGRKTWESMGSKPLPNRTNLVLTRDKAFKPKGAEAIYSIEQVLELSKEQEVMIIGGSEIFLLFLPLADRLLVTLINEEIEGDVVMPDFDLSKFELTDEKQGVRDEKNPYDYRFLTYDRIF